MRHYRPLAAALLILLAHVPAADAGTRVFSDDTFDLDDYTAQVFQTGSPTVNTFQSPTLGNPSSALVTQVSNNSTTAQYWEHETFVYDPASSGPVISIDVTEDLYLARSPSGITSKFVGVYLVQDGNYYLWSGAVPAVNAAWHTGGATGLPATSFRRVTNFLTLATTASHPNFSGNPIRVAVGVHLSGSGNYDARIDNVAVVFHNASQADVPIPVPAILALAAAIGVIGARASHRSGKGA